MNRTDRLYAIAEELRAAGDAGRTGRWLAERFEVAERTIKRDVSALQQAGVPVTGIGGRGGGYVLDAGATLPPVAFTVGEAVAIAAALTTDPSAPYAADGRSALTKVLGAMGPGGAPAAAALGGRIWIRPERPGPAPRSTRVVEEALRRGVVVVIDYADRSGAETRRRPVEPLAFAHRSGRWYLLAWCRWRRDGRWFRLDRIGRADLTAESATHRDLVEVFGPAPDDSAPLDLT